ncbi:MAG: FAD-dependent oxidoreductase [Proteobacteria bacterium]|nr:FAD-dependent oxidoreductase [Pseudomonadota bacterium]
MRIPLLVIGGGLSGLAAAIRAARFIPEVLLVEKHSRLGGLNSYFYRNNTLYETGLHAITNYADPGNKKAPLNRLFRQLKLRRNDFSFCQQIKSEVVFRNLETLAFSNDADVFETEVRNKFPQATARFQKMLDFIKYFDPFTPSPFRSTRSFLKERLQSPLLAEMILCPLMYYGSSREEDMDLSQFVIMYRAIFQEGMFRPQGTIKDLINILTDHYLQLCGTLRKNCEVKRILITEKRAVGVELENGEVLECDNILSTIGHKETLRLISNSEEPSPTELARLGFVETMYQLRHQSSIGLPKDKTIIFFNNGDKFSYKNPTDFVDFNSGVICFPANFHGLPQKGLTEIRSTHLANYSKWKLLSSTPDQYSRQKQDTSRRSAQMLENLTGSFALNIVYENTFTPVTIERYTAKISGAIYGSPEKIKDGNIGYPNLFLAGTDQGFLGIIGSMLSGVSIVNQHILPKL